MLQFLKGQDKKYNKQLESLASQLSLHIAAMKPSVLTVADLPQAMKDQVQAEQQTPEAKAKALDKLLTREVFLEQELATSEEPIKIKDLLK